jgi:hypothetical protein
MRVLATDETASIVKTVALLRRLYIYVKAATLTDWLCDIVRRSRGVVQLKPYGVT